jgi:glycosyltransferase involved in cell wall biosynthesis
MAGHRSSPTPWRTARVLAELPAIHAHMDALIEPPAAGGLDAVARRSIVLKAPRRHGTRWEKGVLLVTFTFNFPFFYHSVSCAALLERYFVVLEPSWSDYCQPSFLFWTLFSGQPVVAQATEPRDRRFLEALGSNLVPVPFGASDWVDFRVFRPLPGVTKDYDVAYVANYSPRKRHHVLLRALRRLRRHRLRAALVCHSWGDGKAALLRLIEHYGVGEQVTLYEDLAPAEVNEILNRSRACVLLSRQEGSNRSLFEGFFAGVPGILLRENIGVNKSYLNAETGLLVSEDELPEALLHLRAHCGEYRPREWALAHISPLLTTERLAAALSRLAPQTPWTTGLVPKVNRPDVQYFHPEDATGLPTAREVLASFSKP